MRSTKSIIKQLIIDSQNIDITPITNRLVQLPVLPNSIRKAFVVTGMRRSGKTYFLYQIIQSLKQQGIKKEQILYLNFEDDRLTEYKNNLNTILETYFELYPEYLASNQVYFFLDEIHEANQWEKFIRRLLDTQKMQIYLTGSSAKLLSKEIASSLRGRTLVRELFPFNFKEFLNHKKITFNSNLENITTKQKIIIQHELQQFMRFGGFPETININNFLHRELLQSYLDTVIYRDIVDRYRISNTNALRHLFNHCLKNASSYLSIHKMYSMFKSQGITVSKNSLYEYMNYFEDAYCLFSVPIYNFSYTHQKQTPKKIYPVDQGFILACTIKPDFEEAALLETTVFLKLRQQTDQIYYFHTIKGKEVDFLVLNNSKIELYQVTISLKDPKTRDREVSALRQAMAELNIEYGTIITLDDDIIINEDNIFIINLSQFLLIKTSQQLEKPGS